MGGVPSPSGQDDVEGGGDACGSEDLSEISHDCETAATTVPPECPSRLSLRWSYGSGSPSLRRLAGRIAIEARLLCSIFHW